VGPCAATKHLDHGALVRDALVDHDLRVYCGDVERIDGVQVDRVVLHAERVVEALQLRHALLERHLTAFEASRHRVAGVLTLGTATRGLAALTADTATHPLGLLGRAGCRPEFIYAHDYFPSFTSIRCGTRAIMPRISGRSGNVLV
jgi:hypothetical protein